jgi:hypothetical protein
MMALEKNLMEWEPGEKEELWRQMQEVWRLRERRRRPLPLLSLLGIMFFLAFSIIAAHAISARTDDFTGTQVAGGFVRQVVPGQNAIGAQAPVKSDRL